ncbi:DUF4893 domain-containing protein [Chelativorans sp. AA-79]|uniref:DUF4893 domain-containing protein n=1 Tax=Chelativorans sp. AA-79 TaxID=3028735 RepID=UPI0023F7E8E2|nr:DUF4893 domain-containing protein [Chelativorans sp. AA-79]WEX11430.1 DUF4893 domain-containing protein [Chelativorans sp. AA-79]
MFIRILAFALFFAATGLAHADGEMLKIITKTDSARLDRFEQTRRAAIAEAKAGGSTRDVATFEEILSRPTLSFHGFDMAGDWQCRTIKAGGLASLVIYDWFRCRVTDDGSGWMLEKLTGSQRTKGRFFTDGDKRLIYLGSFFVQQDEAPEYGAGPETDQVGYVYRDGEDRWRIELPEPARESKLDILEFRRAR